MALTFFRIVTSATPTRRDFASHERLGKPLLDPSKRREWQGVSVQKTEQQARNTARDLPALGRFISEIRVAEDDPRIEYARTGSKRGHHTMWAEPDVLLACVVRTVPV